MTAPPPPGIAPFGVEIPPRTHLSAQTVPGGVTITRIDPVRCAPGAAARPLHARPTSWVLAIANATLNYRAQAVSGGGPQAMAAALGRLQGEAESQDSLAVPSKEYEVSNLKRFLFLSMLATLKGYGLSPAGGPIEPAAIEALLRDRYQYWEIDVPHEKLFADD